LQAQSDFFFSNPGTRTEFWEKSRARMSDVRAAGGFNSKLELDCNSGELQGVIWKVLGFPMDF
jgi:hypothetical protein